ncbi:MAG: hypothetical protein Q8K60_08120 [Parachlamydiaceae bacterium]|nr:hypothetical protein [Parachlamydiaceae bacterium]
MIGNINFRCWPEAIIPILNGSASTDYDEFHSLAAILMNFRKKTKSFPEELQNIDDAEKCIKEFYSDYCAVTQIVDVADRVIMLFKSRFMKAISSYKEDSLESDEKNDLEIFRLLLMNASPGGIQSLINPESKNWIKTYFFAITNPQAIQNNVKPYRGLDLSTILLLFKEINCASKWLKDYPNHITKDNIAHFKQVLEMDSVGIPHDEFCYGNYKMKEYYHSNVRLGVIFRALDAIQPAKNKDGSVYSRERAYWDVLQSNLQEIINYAN